MNKITFVTWLVIFCIILVSCDSAVGETPQQATDPTNPGIAPILDEEKPENETNPNESNQASTPTHDRNERLSITVMPEKIDPVDQPNPAPITGEVPVDIMDEIVEDLVQRAEAYQQDIQIIRSESVTWSDGSLGCPKPGELFTQALVDGYWVVLQFDGKEYDYRASNFGYFKLCEGGGIPPISPPTD